MKNVHSPQRCPTLAVDNNSIQFSISVAPNNLNNLNHVD